MVMRRVLAVLAVAAFVSGCTSDHKAAPRPTTTTAPSQFKLTAQHRATLECKQALRYADTFATAQPTTVGAIHRITGGPPHRNGPSHPWSYLYTGKPNDAFAAWCWRSTGNRSYQSYVVGPGHPIFLDVTASGVHAAPVGPMVIT